FQTELNDPRIAACRISPGQNTESALANRHVGRDARTAGAARVIEVHLIEDVEELRPELGAKPLADAEFLEHPHIPCMQRWAVERIPAERPERPKVVAPECRGIEPVPLVIGRQSRGPWNCHRRKADVRKYRTIVAEPGPGVIGAAFDREW